MKIAALLTMIGFLATAGVADAQNAVIFDNQSGESALVKLIGPTTKEVAVPTGAKQAVEAAAGRYTIKVRYGTAGNYRYTEGDAFDVQETPTSRSETTITLHKVVAGNYDTRPISENEFGRPANSAPSGAVAPVPSTTAATAHVNQSQPVFASDDSKRTLTLVHLGSAKMGAKEWKEEKPLMFGMAPMRYEVFNVSLNSKPEEADALVVGLTVNKGGDLNVLFGDKCAVGDSAGKKSVLLGAGTVASLTDKISVMAPTPGGLSFYVPPDMMDGKTMVLVFPKPNQMANLILTGVEGFTSIKLQPDQQPARSTGNGKVTITDAESATEAGISIEATLQTLPESTKGRWIVAADTANSIPKEIKGNMDYQGPIPRPTQPFRCLVITCKGKSVAVNAASGAKLLVGNQWSPVTGDVSVSPVGGVIQDPLAIQAGPPAQFLFIAAPGEKDFTFLFMGVKPLRFSVQ